MFVKVAVGVNGLQGGRDAVVLARILAADAETTLAHVYGRGLALQLGGFAASGQPREARELLERERAAAGLDVEVVVGAERPVGRGLHELAEELGADLLVIGSCRRALLGRVLLGNDTVSSLNGAPCAVAIAPMGYVSPGGGLSSVGVGHDGSSESEQTLDARRELARRYGGNVRTLSVVSLQSIPHGAAIPDNWPRVARELMDDERRRLRGLEDVEGDVTYGEVSEELAQFSESVDLLVVGSRGYGPLGRLMNGSTSNYLAARTRCPLTVLPRTAIRQAKAHVAEERVETRA